MEDTSKIVEAKIDNHNLNIKIEKDGEIVETVITLKKKSFFSLVEADETIKVHGINRINRYGVVHLTVKSPYIVDLSIIPMSDDQKTATEKKRPFDNSTLIDR